MRSTRTLVAFLPLLVFGPALAQSAGIPKSFVPSICASPAPTTTAVSVCLNDGNGVEVPWLNINPTTHLVGTPGVAAETARALAAEALLAPLASPTLTGVPSAPTATLGNNTTQVATTAFTAAAVNTEATRAQGAEALLAPLASPVLTGTPTAPTPAAGDNSLKLPTTAFVSAAVQVEANRASAAETANTTAITAEATTARNAVNLTSGTVPAARLPVPSTSTLGGVQALPATSNVFLTGIGTNGVPTAAQPSFSNISGTMGASQLPASGVTAGSYVLSTVAVDLYGRVTSATQGALSGDVTTTAGSLVATLAGSGVTPGTYGTSSAIPVVTVDGKGRVTSATTTAIAGSNGGTVTNVATGGGLTGGPITSSGTISDATYPMQERITLASGTPVMSTTVSAAGTVYVTPYHGRLIALWNGSDFVSTPFSQLSLSTSGLSAGNVYDVFVWSNGGTVTATFGPAWSAGATAGSNTSRGSGAGSTALSTVNGMPVNAVAISGGPAAGYGTYVGTIATDSGGATVTFNLGGASAGGTAAVVGVWNAYNRVAVSGQVRDSNSSWSYATAAWRAADGSSTNRVTFVTGQAEDTWDAAYDAIGSNGSGGWAAGIGINSATALSGISGYSNNTSLISLRGEASSVPFGLTFMSAIEYANGGTLAAQGTGGTTAVLQSGMAWRGRY